MRCPVCKADNLQETPCRRCKTDLSLLFTLEEQRRQKLAEARRFLHRGEWQSAMEHAESANWLRSDEESRQLAALTHLLNRDFAAAWQSYQNWRAGKQSE